MRTLQETTLTVRLSGIDLSAVLRVGRDGNVTVARFSGRRIDMPLAAGDYIVTLDSELRPGPHAPVMISTDVEAIFMSAGPPADGVRPLIAGPGVQVAESDPKVDAATAIDVKQMASLPVTPADDEVATDVLEVISTTERTDFEWLALHALDQAYASKRGVRTPASAFEQLMAVTHEPAHATRHVAMSATTSCRTEAQISLEVRQSKRVLSELRLPQALLGAI